MKTIEDDFGFSLVSEQELKAHEELLKKKVEETGLILCLTHTYSGYPLVKHAKRMIADGTYKVDAKGIADRMVDEHLKSLDKSSND